jgi:hypothetical protein
MFLSRLVASESLTMRLWTPFASDRVNRFLASDAVAVVYSALG